MYFCLKSGAAPEPAVSAGGGRGGRVLAQGFVNLRSLLKKEEDHVQRR